jgi:hypothetical protein
MHIKKTSKVDILNGFVFSKKKKKKKKKNIILILSKNKLFLRIIFNTFLTIHLVFHFFTCLIVINFSFLYLKKKKVILKQNTNMLLLKNKQIIEMIKFVKF